MKTRTGMILLAAGMIGFLAGYAAADPMSEPAYRVRVQGADRDSASLALKVENDVCGTLLACGYRITKGKEGGSRIVDIKLEVARKELEGKLAVGTIYEGTVQADVVSGNGNVMGKKGFQVRGERFRDKQEAEADAAKKLARQINEWLARVLEPTYRVRVQGTDRDSESLAAQVEDHVTGMLLARGYRIGRNQEEGRRIVDIEMEVAREEVARLDDWRLYEGTVRVEVASDGGKVAGQKSFRARGERSLAEKEAEADAAKRLARQINEWLSTVLPPAKR